MRELHSYALDQTSWQIDQCWGHAWNCIHKLICPFFVSLLSKSFLNGQVWKLSLYHQFGAVKFTLSNKKYLHCFLFILCSLGKRKIDSLVRSIKLREWNANSVAMRENRQIRCIEDETKNKWRKLSNGETGGFRSFCPGSNLSTAIATVLSKITKKSATMEEKRKKRIPVASRNV